MGWILPTEVNGRRLFREVDRSIVFMDSTDLDIADRLDGNPRVTEIVNPEPGAIQELLMLRIRQHRGRSSDIAIPSYQKTAFETPSQTLGMGGTLISAVIYAFCCGGFSAPLFPAPAT